MGTKLQYAISLLETSQNSYSFTASRVHDCDYLQNIGQRENVQRTRLDKLQEYSMDMTPERHNVESIKKTMQMHEDIFKHQVQELHRLYSVQKKQMDEVNKEIKRNKAWGAMTVSDINQSQFINQQYYQTTQTNSGHNFHFQRVRDDPINSREQSGSCSGDTMRMGRGFDLERPVEEGISTGVSATEDQAGPSSHMPPKSNKMSIDGFDAESEVELTLSIGGSKSKKRSKYYQSHRSEELGLSEFPHKEMKEIDSSASFKSDPVEECSDPTNPVNSSSATLEKERNRSHCLFQGLKLK